MGPWAKTQSSQPIQWRSSSSYVSTTTLCWKRVSFYQKVLLRESQKVLFQLVLPTAHRETTLGGCHNDIGHLGLEIILDLMCNHFFWPEMAMQEKKYITKCCQCVILKVKQHRPPGKYCGHPSSGTGPHWLPESGAQEREGGEHPGRDQPFWPVHASICDPVPDCPSNCQSVVWQLHHLLWSAREDFVWPGEEFWKWANCWSLQNDWHQETQDQALPPTDKWSLWKV